MSDRRTFILRDPCRQNIKPLIGFFGGTGGGKTVTSLLVARGIVGPSGRIGLVDTENGRGELYQDMIPGGYKVTRFDPPFRPQFYTDAIDSIESQCDIIIIDSGSHSWDGEGGVLDWHEEELDRMAGDDWKKREACKMAAYIKPKMAFKMMVQRILRGKLPMIINLRAQEKTHLGKNDQGKSVVITDKFTTPIMDKRFIFEMLLCVEVYAKAGDGGYIRFDNELMKTTHPGVRKCLPGPDEQMGIKHGQAIAAWCASPGIGSPTGTTTAPSGVATVKALKKQLWDLLTGQAGKDLTVDQAQQWLWDENLMGIEESLSSASADLLAKTIDRVTAKLGGGK